MILVSWRSWIGSSPRPCRGRPLPSGVAKATPWIDFQGLFRPWPPDRGSSAIPWTPAPSGELPPPVPPASMEQRTWQGCTTRKVGTPATCAFGAKRPGRSAVWLGEIRLQSNQHTNPKSRIKYITKICVLSQWNRTHYLSPPAQTVLVPNHRPPTTAQTSPKPNRHNKLLWARSAGKHE
jgi:hypothetical protein